MDEKHSKEVHYPTWVEEEIAKQTDKKYPVEESQGNLCFTKLYRRLGYERNFVIELCPLSN